MLRPRSITLAPDIQDQLVTSNSQLLLGLISSLLLIEVGLIDVGKRTVTAM